ncbi:MAG: prealbumin-like fold domain-containing protein, partial [Candidatus Cryptobacteroides sp.]
TDKKNHVTLKKVDENGNTITASAVFGFTYTAPKGTTKTSVVTTGTNDKRTVSGKTLYCYTTSNGTISFTGLAAGTYTYQEVTAPNSYESSPNLCVNCLQV